MQTGGIIRNSQIIPSQGYTSLIMEQIRNSQEGPIYANSMQVSYHSLQFQFAVHIKTKIDVVLLTMFLSY